MKGPSPCFCLRYAAVLSEPPPDRNIVERVLWDLAGQEAPDVIRKEAIPPGVESHSVRQARRMGRQQYVGQIPQRAVRRQRLLLVHIQAGAGDAAGPHAPAWYVQAAMSTLS